MAILLLRLLLRRPLRFSQLHNYLQEIVRKIKFCQWCGGPTKHEIPDGEEKMRAICIHCGKIAYQNPKMVVGCLIEHDKKVLLCKRNIQPSHGLWTLPAGYMEMGESAAEGAIRETWEEAGAEVEVLSPFAQLDIPLIGQTYLIFLAKLKKPHFSPGLAVVLLIFVPILLITIFSPDDQDSSVLGNLRTSEGGIIIAQIGEEFYINVKQSQHRLALFEYSIFQVDQLKFGKNQFSSSALGKFKLFRLQCSR